MTSSGNRVAKDIAEQIGKGLKTVFITTASETEGPDLEWLHNDRRGLEDAGFDLFDYTITGKSSEQLEKDLKDIDVVYLSGGNTFYLLLQSRKSGFDKFDRKFMDNGGIYIGTSAGSIVAATDIYVARRLEIKAYEDQLKTFEAFGLVDFVVFPHWGSEYFKDTYLDERIENAYVEGNKIILLTDTQYIEVDGDMYKIIDVRDKNGN